MSNEPAAHPVHFFSKRTKELTGVLKDVPYMCAYVSSVECIFFRV